jgi:hypothetical protein
MPSDSVLLGQYVSPMNELDGGRWPVGYGSLAESGNWRKRPHYAESRTRGPVAASRTRRDVRTTSGPRRGKAPPCHYRVGWMVDVTDDGHTCLIDDRPSITDRLTATVGAIGRSPGGTAPSRTNVMDHLRSRVDVPAPAARNTVVCDCQKAPVRRMSP